MKLTWDAELGRYRRPNGRLVTPSEIRVALNRDLQVLGNEAADLANQLRSGQIDLSEWHGSMRELIKQTHITSTALAVGGREQARPANWGRAGAVVKQEYQRLDGWVTEIISGEAPLDGRLRTRAAQYAQAGRQTYTDQERVAKLDSGFTEERSVLHPAEHCGDCISEAVAGPDRDGWRPIGQMIPIGQRECRRGCKCSVEFRRAA